MNKSEKCDFDIIIGGGGPAGMAAAIAAAMTSSGSVAVLEKKEITGKKLSITGNGRCNLSNARCAEKEEVDSFFRELGLMMRTDQEGRMYPFGEEAGKVADLLRDTAKQLHTEIITNCQILWVKAVETGGPVRNGGFLVGAKAGGREIRLRCRAFLLATGGKSYGKLGSTGDGYPIARVFGHKVERPVPSLVPVTVKEDLSALAGVRVKGKARLFLRKRCIFEEEGEIQFNRDCLSGICLLNLSRKLELDEKVPREEAFGEYRICLDLAPQAEEKELFSLLQRREAMGIWPLEALLKEKLALQLWKLAGGNVLPAKEGEKAAPCGKADLQLLSRYLKEFTFHVTGTKGWDQAQVTRGGVSLKEINLRTMESKLVSGLYFAGEVTDYDGPCGGYNLHYAWLSGIRAGKDMARHV